MTRLVEDRALLDAFRRGDRAALAEVYREYVRPLYALVATGFSFESGGGRRWFAGYHDPWVQENTVQEVFARAFTPAARNAYDGLRPYRNYLFTIGRNLIMDALRARSHEEVTGSEPDAGDEVAPAPAPAAEEELAARQLESHCAAFCAALDSPARALFEARFRAGLSVEETARRLQVSEHQVKRGERHLKKRFFLEMKRHGYFEGYRLGRGGLERAALLLILCAGAQV